MVSDFITENHGYLCLTQAEYDTKKLTDPEICMGARTLHEYGESLDIYWTGTKFMKQMSSVVKIAETKYPTKQAIGYFGFFTRVDVIWHLLTIRSMSIA